MINEVVYIGFVSYDRISFFVMEAFTLEKHKPFVINLKA